MEIVMVAEGQNLSVRSKPDPLVAGATGGALRLRLCFDSEWVGWTPVVSFGDGEYWPVVDGECPVPDSVAAMHRFPVTVVGVRNGSTMATRETTVTQKGGI